MALHFVLGSSGSGKTTYMYRQIIDESLKNPRDNYIMVVPEQFTLETQRDMVMNHPNGGVINIDIVSFNRMAFRVFEELGINRLSILDDTGKTLILRRILEENKEKLLFFKNKASMFGFIEEMKSSISELYQYGITMENMDQLINSESLPKAMKNKLSDIKLIYSRFDEYVKQISNEKSTYITKEEVLSKLCLCIYDSKIIRNSHIYLDGFTGFTPVQNSLLKLLMMYAKDVNIAVTIDEENAGKLTMAGFTDISEHEIFAMSKNTINEIIKMAADEKISVTKPYVCAGEIPVRYIDNRPLAHIERNLFRYRNIEKISAEGKVSVKEFENPLKEAEYIARAVRKLVIKDSSLRYRDIAVICGDLETDKRVLERVFIRSGIPYFMDNKRSLIRNPFVDIIRSSLSVIDSDFSYESVFGYMKNTMSNISDEEACVLENYVLACGIKGYREYSRPFKKKMRDMTDEEFDYCEEIRKKFMEPVFSNLYRDLKDGNIKDMTMAVFSLITTLKLREKLDGYREEFKERGLMSLESEYSQTYDKSMELFKKLINLLGDKKVTLREYRKMLDDGFKEIKTGIIPLSMDQIVVGDIERTRLNRVKYLFVMGVNDGSIPKTGGGNGLLTQSDRSKLKDIGIKLSPADRDKGFIQKFYLYLCLTKPQCGLTLTYSTAGQNGEPLRRSYLIDTITAMFSDINRQEEKTELKDIVFSGREDAFIYMSSQINRYEKEELSNEWYELYSYFFVDEKYKSKLKRVLDGMIYTNTQSGLDKTVAAALFGDKVGKSVTAVEKYAACAYAYFLNYGLSLKERQTYEIKAADIGSLYHSALEAFSRKIVENNMDFRNISDDERKRLVNESVELVTSDYGSGILESSERNTYIINKIKKVTDRSAWAMVEHIKRGNFNPSDFELVLKEGRIDRVDTLSIDDKIYIKIIDYKSGSNTVSPAEIENGLQLQLIYYMDVATKREKARYPQKDVEPGAVFYFNIKDPLLDYEEKLLDDDTRSERLLKEFQMSGIVNSHSDVVLSLDNKLSETVKTSDIMRTGYGDIEKTIKLDTKGGALSSENFKGLIDRVKKNIDSLNNDILSGKIPLNPYKKGQFTPCEYCSYKSVCGFDDRQFDNRFRNIYEDSVKSIEMQWEKGENEGGRDSVDQRAE